MRELESTKQAMKQMNKQMNKQNEEIAKQKITTYKLDRQLREAEEAKKQD